MQRTRRRRRRESGDLPDLSRTRPGRAQPRIFHRGVHVPALQRQRRDPSAIPANDAAAKAACRHAARSKCAFPPGIDDGSRLRSSGNGEAGVRGGPPGDLYVVVRVRPHEIFVRQDDDILCEVPISFSAAALGGEIEVPTLNGPAKLKVPPGTQSGTVFRLRGKGMPNVHGHGNGDEHVRVIVEVPTRLSRAMREKLEEFAKLANDEAYPQRKSFLEKAKRLFGGE